MPKKDGYKLADLLEIFDDHGVEYWTEGKNVGPGWINVQCPFCDDDSNHCGIRKKDLKVHCWRCGKNHITNLLKEVLNVSYREAKQLSKSVSLGGGPLLKTNPPLTRADSESVTLPRESTKHFPILHRKYLRSRGFSPLKTIREFKLRASYTTGKYKFRIIIPIIMDRRLVSFTARDVTNKQEPKYKSLDKGSSIISVRDSLFNYDSVPENSDVIITEGPMDAMKLGPGAVSIFGSSLTLNQVLLLKRKHLNTAFILLDNDKTGHRKSKQLALSLVPICRSVEVVELLKHNDPGELTQIEARLLKEQLNFNS